VLLHSEGYSPPTVLAFTVVHPNTMHGTEEVGNQHSVRLTDDTQALVVVPGQNQTNNKDVEVEDVANGHFEVQLEGMGVPAEDIVADRRIEARLAKAAARAREAARVAQLSTSQMQTRSKGKAPEGANTEAMNQYRKLQEDELRCQLLQQQIQEKRRLLEHVYY
jgi:hypothetical protein